MNNFKKFLEEVTIKNNPGIPGEGEKKPGDKNYIRDIENRAKTRLNIRPEDASRMTPMGPQPSRKEMELGRRIMQLVGQSQAFTRGREEELEKLAKDIILLHYGDILEGVELDIKLLRDGSQVAQFKDECEGDEEEPIPFREIKDKAIIDKIHKAKIGNNIIQGEAKNTKHIINTEEVKDGLVDIFGPQSDAVLRLWNDISNVADQLDWIVPLDIKADMMEQAPEGMAGAVSVDWKPKEYKPKEDEGYDPEEEQEPEEEETETLVPRIRARGIDFPMLMHETVKGIFELIASIQFPGQDAGEEEIKVAQTVKLNVSSYDDEVEDFRTGPEITADFRDFINENKKADNHENMRAFIFGKLMDSNYISDEEFLKLFRGILNNSPEARKKVDEMIDEVISDLNKYELGQVIDVDDEPYRIEDEDDTEVIPGKATSEPTQPKSTNTDYSTWRQKDIQDAIDNALDDGDYKKVELLSKYLKEGAEIYLAEIERINEGVNPHNILKK